MPTPTADYQASINGLLMGAGTSFVIGAAGISGLGNPRAKSTDVQLDGQDGSFAGPDYMDVRTILIHIEIVQSSASAAYSLLGDLKTAWFPSTTDVELHIQLPGLGHKYFIGRPRSLEEDMTDFPQGHISAIGEFVCLNPHQQIP
jgi:hypothetical protein